MYTDNFLLKSCFNCDGDSKMLLKKTIVTHFSYLGILAYYMINNYLPPTSVFAEHGDGKQAIPYNGKVWRGECLAISEFTLLKCLAEKIWQMNRSAKGLLPYSRFVCEVLICARCHGLTHFNSTVTFNSATVLGVSHLFALLYLMQSKCRYLVSRCLSSLY